jgi:hypothetical protein
MMTMPTKRRVLITSDHAKGRQFIALCRAAYDKSKLDDDGAQRLNEHPGFKTYLTDGIRRFSMNLPDYTLAQSILCNDFITAEEVMRAPGDFAYTDEQVRLLSETIPSEDILRWCKENSYAVMPAPRSPLSLLNVRELHSNNFYTKSGGWYANQKFASDDRTGSGWLAIKKTPVQNSTSKTWDEQNKLLSGVERVPNAAEMSYFIMTYFAVRGVRLLENVYVRTSSLDSDGYRVLVGDFGAGGLDVSDYGDDDRNSDVGVSAARKP